MVVIAYHIIADKNRFILHFERLEAYKKIDKNTWAVVNI